MLIWSSFKKDRSIRKKAKLATLVAQATRMQWTLGIIRLQWQTMREFFKIAVARGNHRGGGVREVESTGAGAGGRFKWLIVNGLSYTFPIPHWKMLWGGIFTLILKRETEKMPRRAISKRFIYDFGSICGCCFHKFKFVFCCCSFLCCGPRFN